MAPIAPGRAIKFITADPTVSIFECQPPDKPQSEFSVLVYPNPAYRVAIFTLNKRLAPNSQAQIFDNTGRLIRTLIINSISTTLIWDGKNSEGNDVRAGVYFLRLDDSKNHSITKLILTR